MTEKVVVFVHCHYFDPRALDSLSNNNGNKSNNAIKAFLAASCVWGLRLYIEHYYDSLVL